MRYNHSDIQKRGVKKMIDRSILIQMYERDNEIQLTERQKEVFFEKTEPTEIAEIFVKFYFEHGETISVTIVYNFKTERLEFCTGIETYPDDFIEVYSMYPRWTRDLKIEELFTEDEAEKYRWYIAGRRYNNVECNKYDYLNETINISVVEDFLYLHYIIIGPTITMQERLENIITRWLQNF